MKKKSKKEILAAINAAKKEILEAFAAKPARTRKKKESEPKEEHPLKDHFEALSGLLEKAAQPNRFKVMTIVAPLIDELEKADSLPEGLLDLLPPKARKSIMMLFLFHMLRDADEEGGTPQPGPQPPPRKDFPDRVPLDISEGDNIPKEVIDSHVPYKRRPKVKLDTGF